MSGIFQLIASQPPCPNRLRHLLNEHEKSRNNIYDVSQLVANAYNYSGFSFSQATSMMEMSV